MFTQRRKRATRTGTARSTTTGSITSETSAKEARGPQPSGKLYSMAGLLREHSFAGNFNARGATYRFTYSPTAVAVNNRKLELTGNLSVKGPRGAARTVNGVRATMLAQQGGIYFPLLRRQLAAIGTTGDANVATPDQKQEQAKAPETASQPAIPPVSPPMTVSEWTGPLSFVGVMYFRFQPLDGAALGVPLDLSSVQLNARIAPETALERDLQFLYSDLIEAVYGDKPDEGRAAAYVREINRVLKG